MADSFSFKSSLARRALPWLGRLATLATLALLAWLGARAFWSLATPATSEPAMVVDTDALRVSQAVAARHLFGESRPRQSIAAGAGAAANVKLQGVFAPTEPGHLAIAIVSSQGKPAVPVREGEEVAPGVTLHRVLPRSVEIDQGGQIVPLAFPERAKSAPTDRARPATPNSGRRPRS